MLGIVKILPHALPYQTQLPLVSSHLHRGYHHLPGFLASKAWPRVTPLKCVFLILLGFFFLECMSHCDENTCQVSYPLNTLSMQCSIINYSTVSQDRSPELAALLGLRACRPHPLSVALPSSMSLTVVDAS